MSPRNRFILEQKVKGQVHEAQKQRMRGLLHSRVLAFSSVCLRLSVRYVGNQKKLQETRQCFRAAGNKNRECTVPICCVILNSN